MDVGADADILGDIDDKKSRQMEDADILGDIDDKKSRPMEIAQLPPLLPGLASRKAVFVEYLIDDPGEFHLMLSKAGPVQNIFYTSNHSAIVRYNTVRAAYTAYHSELFHDKRLMGVQWPTTTSDRIAVNRDGHDEHATLFVAWEAGLVFRLSPASDVLVSYGGGLIGGLEPSELDMIFTRLIFNDKQTGYNAALVALAISSHHIDRSTVDLVNDYPELEDVLSKVRTKPLEWNVWDIRKAPLCSLHRAVFLVPGDFPPSVVTQ